MSADKMREEFEAKYPRPDGAVWNRMDNSYWNSWPENDGDKDNEHELEVYNARFEAWQASRESLVIELPDDGIEDCQKEWPERGAKYEYDTFDTGYLFACMKHEQAIEAAGLKVKA